MSHKSNTELITKILKAESRVDVGELYVHYKKPDDPYQVQMLCIQEANDKVAVIYEHCESGIVFVRDLNNWCDIVGDVNRFTKYSSKESALKEVLERPYYPGE